MKPRFSRRSYPTQQVASTTVRAVPTASAAALMRPLTVSESLWCGAVARTVQILTMYPVDTIKTRVQYSRTVTQTAFMRLRSALGQGALYRAVAPCLVGQIPYGMITFGALEASRNELRRRFPDSPQWATTAAAATIGDTLGSLCLVPSEVIKQKTQAGVYSGAGATIGAVFRERGLPGFYQGYGAALARDVPFRIVQFGVFEGLLAAFQRRFKRRTNAIENLLIGALAGTAAAAVTCPLDVVRTRMMSQAPGAEAAFKNAFDCVAQTVRKEGVQAMFRGITPRCLLIGPSSAVFFLAYEATKRFFLARAGPKDVGRIQAAHTCSATRRGRRA